MNKKLSSTGKKSTKKITFNPKGVNLTSQAGLVSTAKFLESKKITAMIQDNIDVTRGDNATYQFHDIIEYCVLGIIGGGISLDGIGEIWKDHSLLENQIWSDIEGRPGWQESTFEYKCNNWENTRIFKAVRLEIAEENPDEVLIEVKKYSYFCYVTTDLELTPLKVHKKYGERATCETWIEESKNQVALANIKMDDFEGASILFQCSVIAYNTFRYMGMASGNKKLQQWEPATIRTSLIRTAGKLLTGNRQFTIITPINHFHQDEWDAWVKTGGLMNTG